MSSASRRPNPAARRLGQCVEQAIAGLGSRPLSDEAVHAARKALKKARAALRLLRPALGEAAFRAQNAGLRDAGRALAPLRNNASLLGALEALGKRHPELMQHKAAERLNGQLLANRERARRRLAGRQGLDACLRVLERSRRRSMQPSVTGIGGALLKPGLKRVYRTGRNAFSQARKTPSAEALHEWRKQVKYLANALEILQVQDGRAHAVAAQAETLAQALGEHHDLSELAGLVPPKSVLRALIDQRRRKIEKRAFKTGQALYRDRPGRFAARLR